MLDVPPWISDIAVMAFDILKQLDVLDENEVHDNCDQWMKKVQLSVTSSDGLTQAQLISTFIRKLEHVYSESKLAYVLKSLFPTAETVCNSVFKDLQAGQDATSVSQLLQAIGAILDSMCYLCSKCVLMRGWQQVALLASMLLPAFQCIKATYAHCQDSSRLYGSLLASVNGPLTSLFRSATGLQADLHQLADTVVPADGGEPSGQQVTLLVSVCDAVADTGRRLTSLDTRAMAEAWKCYLRLLQRMPDRLPPAVRLSDTLSFMAGEVAAQLDVVTQRRSEETSAGDGGRGKRLARAVKMCSFYLKLVVSLSESYIDCLGDALANLVRLVFTLIRHSAPDSHVTDLDRSVLSQLSSQLTVAAEPLLDCLMKNGGFPKAFWSALWSAEDLGGLCRLRGCLLLVRRACHLPAAERTSWMGDGDGEKQLVAAVLRLMPNCDRELTCGVQVDCDGHRTPQVSLYEHTLVIVCALIGGLSTAELRTTEPHLWRHLCRGDGWSSLLAADCLCFVARCGPASLCRQYCDAAAGALSRSSCPPLRRLLCRLVPLLTEEDRRGMLRRPDSAALLRTACPPELLEAALGDVERLADSTNRLTADQVTSLSDCLYACGTALSAQPAVSSTDLSSRLLTLLERLWATVPARLTGPAGTRLAVGLIRATAAALSANQQLLTDHQLARVLSVCAGWLPGCSVPVKLGIIGLLGSIKRRQYQPSTGDHSPKQYIPALYRDLLTDSASPLVRQRGRDAFADFASCTPHAALISGTVATPAGLQAEVSEHLQRLSQPARGTVATAERLSRAGVSSAAAVAVVRTEEAAYDVPMDTAAVPASDESPDRPVAGTDSDSAPPPAPSSSSLPPRAVELLESIQRRLDELRRGGGRGGAAGDGERLLRLLTDLHARLDAG